MDEQTPRTLNHFALLSFTDTYWSMNEHAKAGFHEHWLAGLSALATNFDIYQNTGGNAELLTWCAVNADEECATSDYFEKWATITTPYRHLMRPLDSLWGYTRPSQYSEAGLSAQVIDPLATTRANYLVIHPFARTNEWYALSQDDRQAMMEEHMRVGEKYAEIKKLVLYSTGIQDHEFVVVCETDDLPRFSELVMELRGTRARKYTLKEAPVYTAVYHPAAQTLALWK
ncbi:MAG TPA: chlorite dismutase family protein [Anaerolineales bacterium]|nr:chlorite dismutase family protein [Anaerolineales bacterium]